MLQAFISILFFITFSVYLFLGIYSLCINPKAVLNRIFLLICMAFSIWTITFAISNSAGTLEKALFWRRMSVLGWGISYSMIIHYILVLTQRYQILKKRWIYLVIYLPTVFNVLFFGLYNETANSQYVLINTIAGWAFIPSSGILDLYFNIYYVSCFLITIGLLYRWGKKTKGPVKKKHIYFVILSIIISFILGAFTDSVANRILRYKFPSLSPIFIIIPTATVVIIMKKYGLMDPLDKKRFIDEGIILGNENRRIFFKYIASMFYMGSILNLLHFFLYPSQLLPVILLSTILLFIGVAIFLLPYSPWNWDTQDNIMAIITAISIPLVLFRFLDNYASNIVWPIPLLFMMVMAVFNKKRMLMIVAISGLTTGIVSWIRVPKATVYVTGVDYVSRIVLYGMGIILTLYINKIYIYRLAENEDQVRFQKMISEISTDFITVTDSNYNEKVHKMLKRSAEYFRADRSYFYLFSGNLKVAKKGNEWCKEGFTSRISIHQEILIAPYGWWMEQMKKNKVVFISEVEKLPLEASREKEFLLKSGLNSVLAVPLSKKEKVIGFIAFDGIKGKKSVSEMDSEQLKILANTLADASSKVEAEIEINNLAYKDILTGLPNRALFKNWLEEEILMAKKNKKLTGVMLIDLGDFKKVNDSMGHEWGDYVLLQVADRISCMIEKADTVARFGGDEFLIMFPQMNTIESILNAAQRIMKIFKESIVVQEQEFFITASGGIAVYPIDGENVETLIKHADLAMYSSKNRGKNQFSLCTQDMKEDVINKMKLTNSLYKAIDNDELELYYQPQVSTITQEIVGIEALIRWNHPTLGRIPPSVFIPLAEQTGLITSIGTWVLKTACCQNKRWQSMGFKPVRIAVNISLDQFRGGNLLQVVRKTLQETKLDPSYLELEITEGIAMKEDHLIVDTLRELREMGVEVSIDDFGMAYSSLSRLKALPVDRLKIDMVFVRGIFYDTKDRSIIEVIIYLAKNLGLKVTAEGVETKEQLDFLARSGCDDIQGYYYYKPMPAHEVERILIPEERNNIS